MSDGKMDKKALRWQKIEQFLQTHEYIMNADVRELCGVSAATANRVLAELVESNRLIRSRIGGIGNISELKNSFEINNSRWIDFQY